MYGSRPPSDGQQRLAHAAQVHADYRVDRPIGQQPGRRGQQAAVLAGGVDHEQRHFPSVDAAGTIELVCRQPVRRRW